MRDKTKYSDVDATKIILAISHLNVGLQMQ